MVEWMNVLQSIGGREAFLFLTFPFQMIWNPVLSNIIVIVCSSLARDSPLSELKGSKQAFFRHFFSWFLLSLSLNPSIHQGGSGRWRIRTAAGAPVLNSKDQNVWNKAKGSSVSAVTFTVIHPPRRKCRWWEEWGRGGKGKKKKKMKQD